MGRFNRIAGIGLLVGGALLAGCQQGLNDEDRATLSRLESSVNSAREEARGARVTAERAQATADQAARAAQTAAERAEQAANRAEEANERANRMFQYNLRK
jgi:hypothetical protein